MAIILTRESANELSFYTQKIINLILECQNQLTRQDILLYFRNNPDGATSLLTQAQNEVRAFPIVVRGLKEKLNSEILPQIPDIDHPEGWLNVGDIFIGITGSCHTYPSDRPYVVTSQSDSGYEWRYIDELEETSRPPMRLDPKLKLYAWWKVPDTEDEIKNFLITEIDALTGYVNYLKSFSAN